MEIEYFYSNGKLLISGEYLVLKGALAFAIPLKFGQSLEVNKNLQDSNIHWEAYMLNKPWFKASFNPENLEILSHNNAKIAHILAKIFYHVNKLNKNFINRSGSISILSKINFDINWGLGSSSSLISNIAYWSNIDPFILHKKTSPGSGYDVACARAKQAIFYKLENSKPFINEIDYNPSFNSNIYFVYLGHKQNSERSVKHFYKEIKPTSSDIENISDLTKEIVFSKTINDLKYYIKQHEEILSKVLKQERIRSRMFPDFHGEIKSLGAWGGDFIMAVSEMNRQEVENYFINRKLTTIFSFNEIILK